MNRSRIIAVVVILIIIAAAVVGWLYYQANPEEWDSFVDEMSGEPAQQSAQEPQRRSSSKEGLQASGAIEADEIVVSSPSGGLIMHLYADEGQRISQGELLLEIDDRAVQAQRKALSANLDQADAALQMAQTQLDSVKAGPRSEEIAAAEGAVQMAMAQVAIANSGLDAIKAAIALGAEDTSPTEYDLEAAEAQVDLAEGQLAQAQAQLVLVSTGATSYDIALLEAQVAQAEAAKNAAQAALDALDIEIENLSISAPIDGVILQRLVNPGELAVPGGSLFLIADLQNLYLTVYVPEAQLVLGQTLYVLAARGAGQEGLKEAAAAYEAVTRLAPRDLEALHTLGDIYRRLG
ncbi:MAG: HlyD family secretion protein, partial [Candidatus Promineifilaceae bacterium]